MRVKWPASLFLRSLSFSASGTCFVLDVSAPAGAGAGASAGAAAGAPAAAAAGSASAGAVTGSACIDPKRFHCASSARARASRDCAADADLTGEAGVEARNASAEGALALSADLESGVLGPLSPGARGTANTGAARCPGGGGGAGTPCHGIWSFSLQLLALLVDWKWLSTRVWASTPEPVHSKPRSVGKGLCGAKLNKNMYSMRDL